MAGKWAAFKSKLEKFKPEPEYQAKVDEAKKKFVGHGLADLARLVAQSTIAKRRAKAELFDINLDLAALELLLQDEMEAQQISKVETVNGITVYLRDEPYATVTDKPSLYGYIKRTKQTNLLTINFKTMNALVKEELVAGRPAPPGVNVYMKTKAACLGIGGRLASGSAPEGEDED